MLVIFLYDYIVPVMSTPTTSASFQRGVAYKGQTRIGDPVQVVFIETVGEKYTVEYKGKRWSAEYRQGRHGSFFQIIDRI